MRVCRNQLKSPVETKLLAVLRYSKLLAALRYSKLLAAQEIRLSCLAEKGLRDGRGDSYLRTLFVRGPEVLGVNVRFDASPIQTQEPRSTIEAYVQLKSNRFLLVSQG